MNEYIFYFNCFNGINKEKLNDRKRFKAKILIKPLISYHTRRLKYLILVIFKLIEFVQFCASTNSILFLNWRQYDFK